jgi:hypothetical protein
MTSEDKARELYGRIYAATDPQSILDLLGQARLMQDNKAVCTDREEAELLASAFRALNKLTRDDISASTHLVMELLLPLLDQPTPDDWAMARSHWRDVLVDWLDAFSPSQRDALRGRVLDHEGDQLRLSLSAPNPPHPESACWTIARIGLRRDDLVETLWQVVTAFDDERGDVALATLSFLGIPERNRQQLVDETIRRAHQRRAQPLSSALRQLADPMTMDVVRDQWLSAAAAEQDSFEVMVSLGIFTEIADVADGLAPGTSSGPDIGAHVWRTLISSPTRALERFRASMYIGGHLAPACNSEEVISSLLAQLLVESADDEGSMHRRDLLYRRMAECVRPEQLKGWRHGNFLQRHGVLAVLQSDALRDSSYAGPYETLAGSAKEHAWETALRWGHEDVFAWFDQGVAHETNLFAQRHLCELLASFRLTPTPQAALHRVTRPLEIRTENSADVNAYLGALALVGSSATWEAFDALLHTGSKVDGHWLDDAARSLARVAVSLVRQGNTRVIPALFDLLTSDAPDSDRTAAATALEELAALKVLDITPNDIYGMVIRALADDVRSGYQRALLIMILGHTLLSLPQEFENNLVEWARTNDDWVGWVSIETLGHFGQLGKYEDVLRDRLAMQRVGARWDLKPLPHDNQHQFLDSRRDGWLCGVVASLYRHEPSRFAPAVVSCLSRPSLRMIDPILQALEDVHVKGGKGQIPRQVVKAMIERLRRWSDNPFSRPELFSIVARVIPDRFVSESWSGVAQDWSHSARAALTDALGVAQCTEESATRRATEQALSFFGDGQYAVRRAAYRAVLRQSPTALQAICATWAIADDAGLRQRAAEACAWLPMKDQAERDTDLIYATLLSDIELRVREAALRARKEQRYRMWAEHALSHLLEGVEWTNENVMRLWPFGEALIRVGFDDVYARLRDFLIQTALPPHIRHWLDRILHEGEKHWSEVVKKWPEPWDLWRLDFQYVTASGGGQRGNEVHANLIAWRHITGQEETALGALLLDHPVERTLQVGQIYPLALSSSQSWQAQILGITPIAGIYKAIIEEQGAK